MDLDWGTNTLRLICLTLLLIHLLISDCHLHEINPLGHVLLFLRIACVKEIGKATISEDLHSGHLVQVSIGLLVDDVLLGAAAVWAGLIV